MKKIIRWIAVIAILVFLAHNAPQSNPIQVGEASAIEAGWYKRSTTFWMDDSDLGVFRVKHLATWETRDPSATCFRPGSAAPDGTQQWKFLPSTTRACWYRSNHSYDVRNVRISCWISDSWFVTINIHKCGHFTADWNYYPPYSYVVGSIFGLCIGLPNTPFQICKGTFKSSLTIVGSSVHVWNSSI